MRVLGTRVADSNFYLAQGPRLRGCYGCFSALNFEGKGNCRKKILGIWKNSIKTQHPQFENPNEARHCSLTVGFSLPLLSLSE